MSTELEMSRVFHALAHESRRKVLDILKATPGIGVGKLAAAFDVSRIAIMNHLAVLEGAGLVVSQRDESDGRTRRLYLNTAPIQMINDRWMSDYSAHWAERITRIKYAAEAAAKTKRGKPK
jgi:DNA-binding transcriptional ArsR family regulator